MKILIKPLNDIARDFYENHSHFHKGDSGLDLYLLEDGSLLRTCRIQSLVFGGGGSGGRVEKR